MALDVISEAAMAWTRRGAIVMVFGCAPVGKTMKICPEEIFAKELTILGTLVNPYTFSKACGLAANLGPEKLDLGKLGIAVSGLDGYKEGLAKLKAGEISKLMFDFSK